MYLKYLLELNVSAELFAAQNFFYDYYKKSLVNKLKFKTGISTVYREINSKLIDKVNHFKPDLIWVFKGMEVLPSTLVHLKKKSIRTVNYNPDNPFIFSGKGSGNSNVTKSISLYDLHLTYNLSVKKKLQEEYHKPTFFLPFGFELSESLYHSCCEEREIGKICFLGNPDKKRADFIRRIADAGMSIDVFGNDWSDFLKHARIKDFPPVYGDEFWRTLRRYRVQLNLMRRHNDDSHNMRSFEVPGVGGIMLAPDTAEHRLFFKDGEEVFLFSSIDDCVTKANAILSLSNEQAAIIRSNAHRRSISSGYAYKDRTGELLQYFQKLYA